MSRLILVSNRVVLPGRGGGAQGGLVTGLSRALAQRGGIWFGWNGRIAERTPQAVDEVHEGTVSYALTPLTRQEFEGYYVGFANRCLWPVCHAQLHLMNYSQESYATYQAVNERWARLLAPLIGPDDLVWIHDYHLFPLGAALRRHGCTNPLGFFLHTPFPGVDLLRALPGQTELLEGVLTYDLVGFQTPYDVQSFLRAVTFFLPKVRQRVEGLNRDGHLTRVNTFPIGIDVDEVSRLARAGRNTRHGRRLTSSLGGRRLILGTDRLDYSKGLIQRFRAYAEFLEHWPEFKRQVVFLQIAPLSRTEVQEYAEVRESLNTIVGDIHARFAEYDWLPLRYLARGFQRSTILGFLSQAEIGLVTPLRDGMNLVAKEFVAAHSLDNPGVLILSCLAGAAQELSEALIVNPYDTSAMARAMAEALRMSLDERKIRWQALMARIRRQDLTRWTESFLEALEGIPHLPVEEYTS